MSGIAHVAVGGAIGYAAGNPVLGFLGGLLSHILLDRIPHRELFNLRGELFTSAFLFVAIVFLVPTNKLTIIAGIVGSCLPDIEIVFWLKGILRKEQLIFPTHNHIFPQKESKSSIMVLVQISFILSGLIVISQGLFLTV